MLAKVPSSPKELKHKSCSHPSPQEGPGVETSPQEGPGVEQSSAQTAPRRCPPWSMPCSLQEGPETGLSTDWDVFHLLKKGCEEYFTFARAGFSRIFYVDLQYFHARSTGLVYSYE